MIPLLVVIALLTNVAFATDSINSGIIYVEGTELPLDKIYKDETRWIDEENKAIGLIDGPKGAWVTADFKVNAGGSNKLFLQTYLTAFVGNDKGNPALKGGYLYP